MISAAHRSTAFRRSPASSRAWVCATDPAGDAALEHCQSLRRRARRLARHGDYRKAAVLLRTLVSLQGAPSHWVLLGDMLSRAQRFDEARHALKQGLWLNRQAGAHARAATVAGLIARLA